MSSFFTLPPSQKKRKRPSTSSRPSGTAAPKRSRENDEGSISGSDSSGDDSPAGLVNDDGNQFTDEDEEDEFQYEDAAAKRLRLAEQYLANTQQELLQDEGFDAADVDEENLRRRMGDRLKGLSSAWSERRARRERLRREGCHARCRMHAYKCSPSVRLPSSLPPSLGFFSQPNDLWSLS